ncbi:MAG: ATP-binding protein [Acidobacteriota bacterium]
MTSETQDWPESPYKGLAYYDTGDRPIFTGREDEIDGVSRLLDEGQTRVLLLHGETGCGKSSFLRAGLIPYLEELRFKFLHEERGNRALGIPVFITASGKPLLKLGKAIFEHISADEKDKLPEQFRYISPDEFASHVATNPKIMGRVLKDLASRSLKTLVLIIDQAEEVMTLWPENSENEDKTSFFEFLYVFSSKQINVKLILSLRTEYYGKFMSGLHSYTYNMSGFRDYYLKPIADNELRDAIELPTKDEPINGYGAPRDKYKFTYEEGLVDRIARDLNNSNIIGSRLAVMQVICKRLYESSRAKASLQKKAKWTIKCSDYAALGNIPDQLNAYIDETLTDKINEANLPDDIARLEINRWKNILYRLIDSHNDGRVTKRYETEGELVDLARKLRCSLNPKDTLEFLAGASRQILRQEVQSVFFQYDSPPGENLGADQRVTQYTLAHDAIGLALKEWKGVYDTISAGRKHRVVVSAAERDDFILNAANYNLEDLYEQEDRPIDRKLSAVNDFLWDHQILAFAQHKRFFKRLGIDLDFLNIPVDTRAGHHQVEDMLASKDSASVLVSYPRFLIAEDASRSSLDFAISNVFTGYALITRQSLRTSFEWDQPIDSFLKTFGALSQLRVAAEDEGAAKFVKTLQELLDFTKLVTGVTSGVSSEPIECQPLLDGRQELFKKLEHRAVDVLVVTAPSRAYATQAGYPIYFDSNDALHLLESIASHSLDIRRREELERLNRDLIVHNCWNINVAERKWENDKELTDLILRLASVALFASTYIRRSQEEVTKYLQQLNEWISDLDFDVMRDTFELCYDFSLTESYFDSYLDRSSKYYYRPAITDAVNRAELSNPHKVYKRMMGLRHEYYEMSERFEVLKLSGKENNLRVKAQRLKERSRRHYHIFNYVDAVSILERACEMLSNGKY